MSTYQDDTNSWGEPTSSDKPANDDSGWGESSHAKGSTGGWGKPISSDKPANDDSGWGESSHAKGSTGGWGKPTSSDKPANDDSGWGESSHAKGSTGGWGKPTSSDKPANDDGGWGESSHAKGSTGGWGEEPNSTSTKSGGWGDDSLGGGTGWDDQSKTENQSAGGWDSGNSRSNNRSGGIRGGQSRHNDEQRDDNGQGACGEERPAPYKPEELDLEEEAKLQNEGVGENFHRYKEQKVTCVPIGAVKPIEKFSDVIESKLLLENVKNLKYSDLTPIQKWAMPAIIEGHDIIGCAQTGSGKTAAFLLPILQAILKTDLDSHDANDDCQHPYCLVISPTRELAKQIYTHAEMLSKDSIVKCRVIYGQIATAHLKAKMSLGCHVLVATPGRLKDFVQRGWIGFKNIRYIVLDEGDRLVDDGFMTDIRSFFSHESMPAKENRQTFFFSATFKKEVQTSAQEFLKENFVFLTVGRVGAANEDIKQEFLQVNRRDKKRELKKILNSVSESDKTIVFTQTKVGADMLAAFFTQLGLSSTSIHGDRHQSQREQAITSFKRGDKRFLISSPVGNRGLDLPKVALVINYDLPDNIDEYVHRIGRTGRAGHTGRAISFFDPDRDNEVLPCLLTILEEAKQEVPEWMKSGPGGHGAGDNWDQPSESKAPGDTDDWGASFEDNRKTTTNAQSTSNVDDWGNDGATSTTSGSNKPETNASDAWGSEPTHSVAKSGDGGGWMDSSGSKRTNDSGASSAFGRGSGDVKSSGGGGWDDTGSWGGADGGWGWGDNGSSPQKKRKK